MNIILERRTDFVEKIEYPSVTSKIWDDVGHTTKDILNKKFHFLYRSYQITGSYYEFYF